MTDLCSACGHAYAHHNEDGCQITFTSEDDGRTGRCPCHAFAGPPGDDVPEIEATPVEEKAIAKREEVAVQRAPGGEVTPFDMDPADFRAALERRSANMNALLEWLGSALKDGEHYGKLHTVSRDKCDKGKRCTNPHHFSKNILFKPGAEKINQFLGLTARYRPLSGEERDDYGIVDAGAIVMKCELVTSRGIVVSEGLGARILDPRDGAHALNKAVKMAEKSARINATIQLGLSDAYTQDLDDMLADVKDPEPAKSKRGYEDQDLTPELRASLMEARIKSLSALEKHTPEKMTDEEKAELAALRKVKAAREAGGGQTPHDDAAGDAPSAPGTEQQSGSGAASPGGKIAPGRYCECGSALEERTSKKGAKFITCSLQYRAKYGRDDAAKVTLEKIEEQRPELIGNHTYISKRSGSSSRKRDTSPPYE